MPRYLGMNKCKLINMIFKVPHYHVQFSVPSHLHSITLHLIQLNGKPSFSYPFCICCSFCLEYSSLLFLLHQVFYTLSLTPSQLSTFQCPVLSLPDPYPLHFNCLVMRLHSLLDSDQREARNHTYLPLSRSQCLTQGLEVIPCSTNVC